MKTMLTPAELIRANIVDLEIRRHEMETARVIVASSRVNFIIARQDSYAYQHHAARGVQDDGGKIFLLNRLPDNEEIFNATDAYTVVDVLTHDGRYRVAFHSCGESWLKQWERSGGEWLREPARLAAA